MGVSGFGFVVAVPAICTRYLTLDSVFPIPKCTDRIMRVSDRCVIHNAYPRFSHGLIPYLGAGSVFWLILLGRSVSAKQFLAADRPSHIRAFRSEPKSRAREIRASTRAINIEAIMDYTSVYSVVTRLPTLSCLRRTPDADYLTPSGLVVHTCCGERA